MQRLTLGVDVGGTFTDLLLLDLDTGSFEVAKVPSTPENQAKGFIAGVERLGKPLSDVETIVHGTTIGTNAILERKKTNIHVAADTRYPGMHIPPHIAFEIDLAKCPPLCGDNELGLTLCSRTPNIDSDCMIEALEIDIGWNGHPQTVGYTVLGND